MTNSQLIRRFIPYYQKYKWILVLDLFCATLTTMCDLILPLIVRYITNSAINDLSALTISTILKLGLLYLILRLIDGVANYFMADIGHVMGARIETDMRRDLFSHLQKLPFSFYSDTKIGQLMSRITTDLFDVTEFAHHCPEEFFIAALKIGMAFAILGSINIWLTLIVFMALPVMLFATTHFRRQMRKQMMRTRIQTGEINAQVEDSLLGIRVVKSFANENIEEIKFDFGNSQFLDIKKKTYRYFAGFQTTTRLFDGLMYLLVVVFGGIFMVQDAINPGDYVAYLMYVTTLLTSIRRIVEFAEQFQRGMTGFERFVEILDQPTEYENLENEVPLKNVIGEITFDQVSFHYNDGADEVLSNIAFNVNAGQNVAIVGPSGSGKTTLCHLIPRFYNVTSGKILIDDQDIKTLTLDSLRSQIGVVQQDVYLFAGSVYDNIVYGRLDADREAVIDAARLAGADEFIKKLPDGYDTYIGERGIKLSGGQKQRISIARVFLKNPPILILDEATSALDNESERIIQASLKELTKGRTTLTIAHRLTTIKNADHILVLTEDGIVEQGSHTQLLKEEGLYYDLYQMYRELDELNEEF
ncbi:ABC transporter ATP-binding protein [Eubacteriaceae bacterium ES3]|nr:ABC transporter ATP-binding protein [Eubacteriaceae bacterium ES3]